MTNIIQTKSLNKKYDNVFRVKDLDLRVQEGAIYGFLGPNGAGKSTTLKMILGIAKPTSGQIEVFGKQINNTNRLTILKEVGSLIESPSYYGHLTGKENLRIMQTLRAVPEKNIDEVLHIVRLEKHKDKKVGQYSLGMKQRLGLATAMLAHPKLLILDEPTNGLDPSGIQEMRELICSLPKQYGMTVVVSSHLLSEIDQMATDVGVIRDGELVFQDSLDCLHEKSKHNIAIRTLDNVLAVDILNSAGVVCKQANDYLVLPMLTDDAVAKYIGTLTSNHIGIVRIELWKKSLEDIFLELTKTAVSL
jgi:ABC-2 type transport system ATP-binding protein